MATDGSFRRFHRQFGPYVAVAPLFIASALAVGAGVAVHFAAPSDRSPPRDPPAPLVSTAVGDLPAHDAPVPPASSPLRVTGEPAAWEAPPAEPPAQVSLAMAVNPNDASAPPRPSPPAPIVVDASVHTVHDAGRDVVLIASAPVIPGGPCGASACPDGQVCCNPTCGVCAPPGARCPQTACGLGGLSTSVPCGRNTCNVGDVCCNPSCGTCVAAGSTCDHAACTGGPTVPFSQPCGMQTCNTGEICCNPSCGVCVSEGANCPASCLPSRPTP